MAHAPHERLATGERRRRPGATAPRRTALPAGVPNSLMARALLQRKLDEDFKHGGTPTGTETADCHAFAQKVSDIVDAVHADLLAGRVADWKGAKITTFLNLVRRESLMAITHAGSVVEERVYALMPNPMLGLKWVPQFDEAMGGASKPDIVIKLTSGNRGLVDITSDRGHILRKAGGWTTSINYVYVAEAWFPSVCAEHIPKIKENLEAGGIDDKKLKKMQKEVDAARDEKADARRERLEVARAERNKYGSYKAFVTAEFDGDKTAADAWMRENGMGGAKGVGKKAKKRGLSEEAKKKKRREAIKDRKTKQKKEAEAEKERKKREREEAKEEDSDDERATKRAKVGATEDSYESDSGSEASSDDDEEVGFDDDEEVGFEDDEELVHVGSDDEY